MDTTLCFCRAGPRRYRGRAYQDIGRVPVTALLVAGPKAIHAISLHLALTTSRAGLLYRTAFDRRTHAL